MLTTTVKSPINLATLQIGDIVFEVNTVGKFTHFMAHPTVLSVLNCDTGNDDLLSNHYNKTYQSVFKQEKTLQKRIQRGFDGIASQYRLKIDETTYTEIQLRPQLDGQGQVVSVAGIGFDCSEIVKAEYKQKADVELLKNYSHDLERFAYVASHDLHEPLRMIRSFLGLLQEEYEDKLDEEGLGYIDFAVDGAERLQKLIDDLLLFNRLGRPDLKFDTFSMKDVVYLAKYQLKNLITQKQAIIETHNKEVELYGNFKQIGMVLFHLLENAILFSNQPNIQIRFEQTGKNWLVMIEDNGRGIDSTHHDRVFEIFYKHRQSNKKRTGIGLAICKKIINRHGGKIWLDSEVGHGTSVYFTLPIEQ